MCVCCVCVLNTHLTLGTRIFCYYLYKYYMCDKLGIYAYQLCIGYDDPKGKEMG